MVTSRCLGFAGEDILATSNHPPHTTPAKTEACMITVATKAIGAFLLCKPSLTTFGCIGLIVLSGSLWVRQPFLVKRVRPVSGSIPAL